MPFWNLRGTREALTIRHETYKETIIKYFTLSGYTLYTDSAIQGTLTDLIFKNPDLYREDIETHVEAKWTKFNINNKKILKEFSEYFLLYLRAPKDRRFKFFIFAREVNKIKYHENLFKDYQEEVLLKLYNKIESLLGEKDLEFFKKINNQEKLKFIWDTTLVQVNIPELLLTIATELGDYPDLEDPFLRYKNLKEEFKLIEEKDLLISNLKELKTFKNIWSARTECTSDKEIKLSLKYPPPFYLYNHKILSIYPFSDYNNLNSLIDSYTIKEIDVDKWSKEEVKRNVLIGLLNRTCKKFSELIGLFSKPKKFIYFFPDAFEEEHVKVKWIQYEPYNNKFIKRKNLRNIFKRYFEESPNPAYYHIAINLEAIYFDDRFFLTFIPKKIFTKDGINIISSKRASRLDEKFRDPTYSYNRNLLLEQLFWGFVLFLSPNLEMNRIAKDNPILKEKKFHILKIRKLIDKDYFDLFILNKKPEIKTQEDAKSDEYKSLTTFRND